MDLFEEEKTLLSDAKNWSDLDSIEVPSDAAADWMLVTPRRFQQLVKEGELPSGSGPSNARRYKLKDSLQARIRYLERIASGKSGSIDELKKIAQTELLKEQKLKAENENRRLEIEIRTRASELIPVNEVREQMVKVLRILLNGLDGLPDLLEHSVGLNGDVMAKIEGQIDKWRDDMRTAATTAFQEQSNETEEGQLLDL